MSDLVNFNTKTFCVKQNYLRCFCMWPSSPALYNLNFLSYQKNGNDYLKAHK